MFCMNCGKQLPDDANFCLDCGKPQREGVRPAQDNEPVWEICDIEERVVKKAGWGPAKGAYFAAVIGPKGKYDAGRSAEIGARSQGNDPVLDAFINQLIKDGWEYVGNNSFAPYDKRFRRRVK